MRKNLSTSNLRSYLVNEIHICNIIRVKGQSVTRYFKTLYRNVPRNTVQLK